jgi:hypothetical protein
MLPRAPLAFIWPTIPSWTYFIGFQYLSVISSVVLPIATESILGRSRLSKVRNKPVKITPKNSGLRMIEHTVKLWADYHPGWTSKSFYRALYDGARLEADKIHDRRKIAAHWLRQLKWFRRQVALNAQLGINWTP